MSITKLNISKTKSIYLDNDTMNILESVYNYDYEFYSKCKGKRIINDSIIYRYKSFKLGRTTLRLEKICRRYSCSLYVSLLIYDDSGKKLFDFMFDTYSVTSLEYINGLLDMNYYVIPLDNLVKSPKNVYRCFAFCTNELIDDISGLSLFGVVLDTNGNFVAAVTGINDFYYFPRVVFSNDAKFSVLARLSSNKDILCQ